MRLAVQGFTGPTIWSQLERSAHIFKQTICGTVDVVIPTFFMNGARVEADLPVPMLFQEALEIGYQNALTGLTTTNRYPFRFDGGLTATYRGPGTNPSGFLKGTVTLPPGVCARAGSKVGLWTAIENGAGSSSRQGLPYTEVMSSFVNRFEGIINTATSGYRDTSFIATNAIETATRIDAPGRVQSGQSLGFTPVALIVDYPAGKRVAMCAGSSDQYGVGEGQLGSPADSDSLGNAARNTGWCPRMLNDTFGYDYTNLAKGGDGARFTADPDNTTRRDALLALLNPTDWVEDGDHNSLTAPTPGGYPGAVAVPQWFVFRNGNGVYMVTGAGTLAGGPGPDRTQTDPTRRYPSGTATLKWIGPFASKSDGVAGAVYALRARRRMQVRSIVPGLRIIANQSVPSSTASRGLASLRAEGTTVTAVLQDGAPNTSSLPVGETVAVAGASPPTFNSPRVPGGAGPTYIVRSIPNDTTVVLTASAAPGAGTATTAGTLSDGWQSEAGQSPMLASAYNGADSARARLFAIDTATQDPVFGWNSYTTPYAALEAAPVNTSGFWRASPAFQAITQDGIHSTSGGYRAAAASVRIDPVAAAHRH